MRCAWNPKNPYTWGRGGRARLVTYGLAAFPAGSPHGLVFAGSGGFKTVSTVVSTCLRWSGGMVCLDPTREVADMVKTFRGQGGRTVAILDPRHPEFGFNVLDWIGTGQSTAEEDVATVVGWLTTESPDQGGNSRFFELSSEQLLTGVLGHIVFSPEYENKRTLKALHEFMAQPEASFRKRLAHIHQASTNKFVRDALGPFINLTDETFSGVFKEATNEIDWLKYDPDTVGEITIRRQKPLVLRIMVEQGRTRILFLSGLTPRCEQIFPHRCCFQPVRRIRQQCPDRLISRTGSGSSRPAAHRPQWQSSSIARSTAFSRSRRCASTC